MVPNAPHHAKPIEGSYLVMPSHINTGEPFWGAFGKMEVEGTARHIVRRAQTKGSWAPFAQDFTMLEQTGWIVKGEDGLFRVTDAFIRRCFDSSPATSLQQAYR